MDISVQLDQMERQARMSREANQAVIEGHLAASSVVIAQQAAMAASGVLRQPGFYPAPASGGQA